MASWKLSPQNSFIAEAVSFEVPRELVLNSNQRLHYREHAKRAKTLRELAAQVPAPAHGRFTKCMVQVGIFSPTARRLDPPNLWPTVKPLLDGLTDAGWWNDDDGSTIFSTSFQHFGLSGSEDFRVEITASQPNRGTKGTRKITALEAPREGEDF